ncbi:MAG: tetratricopeptide repeat protein, partial [Thiohalocapsa sp.]
FEAGRYIKASHHLQQFLRYQNDDVEAHQRYAKAQMSVPQPDTRNIAQALRSLQRARELEPENIEVNEQLLGLYELLGKNDEALSLAERMLHRDPGNMLAARGQALALSRLRRYAEALDVTRSIVENNPEDTDMQLLYLEMESKTLAPNEDLIRYAGRMKDEHPDDPRFDLVRAYAHYLADDRQMMTELMRRASESVPPDADYVRTLIRFADAVGLFPLSLRALTLADQSVDDPMLDRELTYRLMELGRYDQVAQRLQDLDASADPLDLEGVSMRVIALMRTDQRELADPIIAQLEARDKDPQAMERGDMLATLFREGGVSADELVVTARTDLQMSPHSPWIRGVQGDAYYAQSEPERAIEQWELASQLRPSWANPLIRQVQPLVAIGKTQEAVDRARAALLRAPTSVDAYRAWALARSANLANDPADSADAILKVIAEVDRLAPGDEGMLRLRMSLLEDIGRTDQARQVLTDTLNSDQELSESTLIDLAARAQRLGLNVDEQAFARSAELHGVTTELTYSRAIGLADRGLGDDGLRLYETALQSHPDDFDWRLNHARYLDYIDSPRAAEVWSTLTAEQPDNDRLQRLALRSPVMRDNRDYTDQIIQRLETIGGSQGATWRIERARWLLESDPTHEQINDAAKLLREALDLAPERVEAKILLARALEKTGKLQLAVSELQQVALSRPDAPAVALELARLQQLLRQYPNALEQLKRVVENPASTPLLLRQAARLLAEQGQDERALAAMLKQQDAG